MSKIVIEQIVCDEHDEEHEAPYYALVQLIKRDTGKIVGRYGIDVCEDVVDWYSSNGTKIIKHPSAQTSRKRAPRKKPIPKKQKAARKMRASGYKLAQVSPQNGHLRAVRAWAISKGLSVSARGRISKEVLDAYKKAH